MTFILEFVATLSAALFCGAAIYINLVEHPARLSCGTAFAVTEFAPSYKRASLLQVALAVLSFLSSFIAWLMNAGTYWLIGSILIILVIPFTAFFMLPINKKLLHSSLDKESVLAGNLLIYWGKLHAVRSFMSFIAVLIFLFAMAK